MVKSIYFTVSGIGLGHAGRSLIIAKKLLNSGFKVYFSSYGEATRYISTRGFKCFELPELRLGWKAEGGLSLYSTSKFLLKKSLRVFFKQVALESRIMSRVKPSIVISDSRGSSILAAKLKSIPIVVITNQLAVFLPDQDVGRAFIKLANFNSRVILPRLWSLSDVILIADLPPPYTISLRNLRVNLKKKNLRYIGLIGLEKPISEKTKRRIRLLFKRSKPLIYVSATGPKEDRILFIKLIYNQVVRLSSKFNIIFSFGEPGGSVKLKRVNDGLVICEWLPNREEVIAASDLLISRAGRSTIDQSIFFQTPLIAIPSERQTEQEENARRITNLRIGLAINQRNIRDLEGYVINALNLRDRFIRNMRKLAEYSKRLGGADKAVDVILSCLK